MRAYAAKTLSPPFQQLIVATKEPFVQSILDHGAPKLVEGLVALLGDAGFIPRPHTAASTSKAAANAMDLAEALTKHHHDVLAALQAWEPRQCPLAIIYCKWVRSLATVRNFPMEKVAIWVNNVSSTNLSRGRGGLGGGV